MDMYKNISIGSVPQFFWLYLPIFFFVAQIAIEVFVPSQYLADLHSEGGPHEILQFIFSAAAAVVAASTLFKIPKTAPRYLYAWLGVFLLGCIYIAGEEVSWGQHFFNWNTPEYWENLNDQGETNLHNTSSWLDQKPRTILLIGVIVGGLIVPLVQKFKADLLPKMFAIIYPPAILGVTAAFALLVKILDKVDDSLKDVVLFSRASELEELYLFYFVMLYLIVLRQRIVSA